MQISVLAIASRNYSTLTSTCLTLPLINRWLGKTFGSGLLGLNSHIKGSNTRMLNRFQTMFSESPDGSHYHYVIHTVGPIARGNVGQSQKDDLESCYKTSLKLMKDNNLRSVTTSGFNEAGQKPAALDQEDVESDRALLQLLTLSPPSGAHELWICFNPWWPQPEGPCTRQTNQILHLVQQRPLRGSLTISHDETVFAGQIANFGT
ncbi:hypothetical protein PO909_019601 [Leuciscus waleckii]